MSLLSKKEFAALCGMTTGNLSNYAARGKIVYTGEELDPEIEPNKSFLEKRQSSKSPAVDPGPAMPEPEPEKKEKTQPEGKKSKAPRVKPAQKKPIEKGEMYKAELERKLLLNQRITEERDLLRRKRMKIDGQYITVDQVKSIVTQLGKSFSRQYWNLSNLFVVEYCKKLNLSGNQEADIKKFFLDGINRNTAKAVEDARRNIRKTVTSISERKGVGEHD